MTISRVELQGQVTRAQDFTNIKQNEDHKGMIDQSNFQSQTQQRLSTGCIRSTKVIRPKTGRRNLMPKSRETGPMQEMEDRTGSIIMRRITAKFL